MIRTDSESARRYSTAVLAGPVARMLGVSWIEMLWNSGIRTPTGNASNFLVNARDYLRLWKGLEDLSEVTHVAKLLGQRMAGGPAIPVLFAMSSAPNFAVGLQRLAQFKQLFGPSRIAFDLHRRPCVIEIVSDDPEVALPPSFSSAQIVYLHTAANALASHRFAPTAVSLPLPRQQRLELIDVFGLEPREGEPRIEYTRASMAIPFVSENEPLWHATEADLRAQARTVDPEASTSERVRRALLASFGVAQPSLAHVCSQIELSRSTLLRKLREEGTSFQSVLDEARKSLAIRYLTLGHLTNQQIAHLTGYRDPNAFQRAFKKWTGTSPSLARAAFANGESSA